MELFVELEKKVNAGELEWSEILDVVNEVKKCVLDHYYLVSALKEAPYSDTSVLESLPAHIPNAEDVLIRIELWEALSGDAKTIALLILGESESSPIYSKTGKITKRKLQIFLNHNIGMSHKRICMAFDELRKYCNRIESS